MEKQDYKNIVRYLENQLEGYMDMVGQNDLNDQSLERIKCFLSAISKAETIVAMRDEGYSGRVYRNDGEYSSGHDNRTGNGGSWRDSGMSRDYSQGRDPDEAIRTIENMMKGERDERRRETMQEIVNKMRNR